MSQTLHVYGSRKINTQYTWFIEYILELWMYTYGICNEIVCYDHKHINSIIITCAKKYGINVSIVKKINIINTHKLIIFSHKIIKKQMNKHILWTAVLLD